MSTNSYSTAVWVPAQNKKALHGVTSKVIPKSKDTNESTSTDENNLDY